MEKFANCTLDELVQLLALPECPNGVSQAILEFHLPDEVFRHYQHLPEGLAKERLWMLMKSAKSFDGFTELFSEGGEKIMMSTVYH